MISSVFITGGGGFIAPHLISALHSHDVFVQLRRTSARTPGELPANCKVLRHDLSDSLLITRLSAKVDTVIHLAGAVNTSSALDLVDANVVTTSAVLDLMTKLRVPHLVFLSTAAVWSGTTGSQIDELTPPSPNTPYGFAKLAAEALVVDAVSQGRIASATILRCNNTYGLGSRQGVIANFLRRILAQEPVQIDGDGMQLREPLYVADLVKLLIKASAESSGLQVYGISGPQAMTVCDMARLVAEVAGRELHLEWVAERSDRSRHLLISTSKVQANLGWNPSTLLRDGLHDMLSVKNV